MSQSNGKDLWSKSFIYMDIKVIISQGFIQFNAQHREQISFFKSEDLVDQNVESFLCLLITRVCLFSYTGASWYHINYTGLYQQTKINLNQARLNRT